nr:MAG TPA: hypothetical protein [Caudoviricetes sp.]
MPDGQLCKKGIKNSSKKTYIYRRNGKAAAKKRRCFF